MDPADEEVFFCNDTDSVKYRTIAKCKHVVLLFYATDLKKIWDYCHEHFTKNHYKCKQSLTQFLKSALDMSTMQMQSR